MSSVIASERPGSVLSFAIARHAAAHIPAPPACRGTQPSDRNRASTLLQSSSLQRTSPCSGDFRMYGCAKKSEGVAEPIRSEHMTPAMSTPGDKEKTQQAEPLGGLLRFTTEVYVFLRSPRSSPAASGWTRIRRAPTDRFREGQ